jgi:transcriptional regulator with PAS, ATPase and Fis domain
MQVKLLRALQERRIRRVGGTEEVDVDVRVIAATNRPLESRVKERAFREDLFYRLNVIPIHLPPLRERRDDIPMLAGQFLRRFAEEMGKKVTQISPEAMRKLVSYSWPGNVRELENVIERAVALETSPAIRPERLPESVAELERRNDVAAELTPGFRLDDYLESVEQALLEKALAQASGDRAVACGLLGITPRSLRYLLQKRRRGVRDSDGQLLSPPPGKDSDQN